MKKLQSFTVFDDPLERIRSGLTARTPIIIGETENDGSFFALGLTNLTAFLAGAGLGVVPTDLVRSLYPGMNDSDVIADTIRDVGARWYAQCHYKQLTSVSLTKA
jgi:carboxylesterase 2